MILLTKICINFHTQVLTLSVGYSLLPYNFIFKSPSNFFCLDQKMTNSVFFFFTLSEILFAFNQLTRYLKSALTCLFSFLIELLWRNILVCSAKWWTLQNFIAWLRSFIYKKKRGPRTDPWGTPQIIAARSNSYPFIDILITIWQIKIYCLAISLLRRNNII